MDFRCQFDTCQFATLNYNWLIKHLWDNHGLTSEFSVTCDIPNCQSKFTSARCYRRHIREKHDDFHNKYLGKSTYLDNTNASLTVPDSSTLENEGVADIDISTVVERAEARPSVSEIHQVDSFFDYETTIADMLLELWN